MFHWDKIKGHRSQPLHPGNAFLPGGAGDKSVKVFLMYLLPQQPDRKKTREWLAPEKAAM